MTLTFRIPMPRVSLGLYQNFGLHRDFATQREIVLRAFELGVRHFDLANNYGPPAGAAEEAFGRILATDLRAHRDEILVSTKAGFDMWNGEHGSGGSRKHLRASLDQSLRRLQIEYVDVFYSHAPDPSVPASDTAFALAQAVSSGKSLYAGVSNYSLDQTKAMQEAFQKSGDSLLLHQCLYSMLHRKPELDLLPGLADLGMTAIAYSPLAQGLLTDRYKFGIPTDSRAAQDYDFLDASDVEGDSLRTVSSLRALAETRGQSLSQLAITWATRDKIVQSAIIGASSVRQLEQNLVAMEATELSPAELAKIDHLTQKAQPSERAHE